MVLALLSVLALLLSSSWSSVRLRGFDIRGVDFAGLAYGTFHDVLMMYLSISNW